jgi:hypothetical protein
LRAAATAKYQYNALDNNARPVFMLNADIALLKAISPDVTTGSVPECATGTASATCLPAPGTSGQVSAYAANNGQWISDFANAFNKMQK